MNQNVDGYIVTKLSFLTSREQNLHSCISLKGECRLVEPSSDFIAKCEVFVQVLSWEGVGGQDKSIGKILRYQLEQTYLFPT